MGGPVKDLLHPLGLLLAGSGFLLLLRDLRRDRRDRALVALSVAYLASALSYAISLTPVWVRVDAFFGVTNIAVPLAQSCVIGVLVAQAVVLVHWALPESEARRARRRTRLLVAAGAAVVAALGVLFTLLTPAEQRPADFTLYYVHDPYYQAYLTLYITTYTVAEIALAVGCARLARKANSPWIARGLRTISVGAVITLGYSAIRIGSVLGAYFGFDVRELEPYAWICGDIGAAVTQVGYFLPTVAARAAEGRVWVRDHLAYRRLGPLWAELHRAVPSIGLLEPPRQLTEVLRLRGVGFHVYRRTVEIRDAQIELRPYLDPAVREQAELRRAAEGLTDPDLAAAVTADQLRDALVRQRDDARVDDPAGWADARLPSRTADEETRLLLRVAARFSPPPAPAPAETPAGARS
ncbi:MAB_1171c family putative transporter [Streptomyces sp. Da 82-17]|uniref:MAB_1171c family putative transporter n=1 Tax=Streptomyces sp. Da 82-17 TaxID=3377116 RepID=UPI0038D4C843